MESAPLIGRSTPGREAVYYGPHVARRAVGCGLRRWELQDPRDAQSTRHARGRVGALRGRHTATT
eukprot:4198340-Prymnesium_polylepis.1